MIEANALSFSYGKSDLIRHLDFSVRPGECLVLTGPNGSGKSTLLSLVAGALRPREGRIHVEGKLGLIPQGVALFEDMSVEDNLLFFAGLAHTEVPESLPFNLDQYRKVRLSDLSGGSQKRVSIACALLGDPANLLLDEPCAGLDIVYREELGQLIHQFKEEGRCIIYVGHEPAEYAPFFDKLLFLGESAPQYLDQDAFPPAEDMHQRIDRITELYHKLCEVQKPEVKHE